MATLTKENLNVVEQPITEGKLRFLGGSKFDAFNDLVLNDLVKSLWLPAGIKPERKQEIMQGAIAGAMGIKPQDEIEGLLLSLIHISEPTRPY